MPTAIPQESALTIQSKIASMQNPYQEQIAEIWYSVGFEDGRFQLDASRQAFADCAKLQRVKDDEIVSLKLQLKRLR